jgi:hypothetical protein
MTRCVIDGFLHDPTADRKSPFAGGMTGREWPGLRRRQSAAKSGPLSHGCAPSRHRGHVRAGAATTLHGTPAARVLQSSQRCAECMRDARRASFPASRGAAASRRVACAARLLRDVRGGVRGSPPARASRIHLTGGAHPAHPAGHVTRCNDLHGPQAPTRTACSATPRRAAQMASTRRAGRAAAHPPDVSASTPLNPNSSVKRALQRCQQWPGAASRRSRASIGRECLKQVAAGLRRCPGWPKLGTSTTVTPACIRATRVDKRNDIDHAMRDRQGKRDFSTSCHNATVAVDNSAAAPWEARALWQGADANRRVSSVD